MREVIIKEWRGDLVRCGDYVYTLGSPQIRKDSERA